MCASSAVLWLELSVHKSRLFRLLQVSFSLSPFFIFLTLYLFMASLAGLAVEPPFGLPSWLSSLVSLSGLPLWLPVLPSSLSGLPFWLPFLVL